MRCVVLGAALLGLPLFPLQANLGSSPEEAEKKYGPEQGKITPVSGATSAIQYADMYKFYNVHFLQDEAVLIQIAGKRTQLTSAQVNSLLRNHQNGQNWSRDPLSNNRWKTPDGRAMAEFDPNLAKLYIVDTAWQRAQTRPPSSSGGPGESTSPGSSGPGSKKGGTTIHRAPGR